MERVSAGRCGKACARSTASDADWTATETVDRAAKSMLFSLRSLVCTTSTVQADAQPTGKRKNDPSRNGPPSARMGAVTRSHSRQPVCPGQFPPDRPRTLQAQHSSSALATAPSVCPLSLSLSLHCHLSIDLLGEEQCLQDNNEQSFRLLPANV